jgi:hypothetical protein
MAQVTGTAQLLEMRISVAVSQRVESVRTVRRGLFAEYKPVYRNDAAPGRHQRNGNAGHLVGMAPGPTAGLFGHVQVARHRDHAFVTAGFGTVGRVAGMTPYATDSFRSMKCREARHPTMTREALFFLYRNVRVYHRGPRRNVPAITTDQHNQSDTDDHGQYREHDEW